MSEFLYITADKVGVETGGGKVTFHELGALRALGDVTVFQPSDSVARDNPFYQDQNVHTQLREWFKAIQGKPKPRLVHLYSGCFSNTVQYLKEEGVKVCYTVAAHNLPESMKEHKSLGLPFNYTHLTDTNQFKRYTRGYRDSDTVVAPSTHSQDYLKSQGCRQTVVIPHGCPEDFDPITPYPQRFAVGYLGAVGPDKGLRYLLEAWKRLSYKHSTLVLAGRETTTPFCYNLVRLFGGGSVMLKGWVDSPDQFYDSLSLYVQPSVTEGFGLEILEAYRRGRPVLASIGAGGHDVVPGMWKFRPRDVEGLMKKIETTRITMKDKDSSWGSIWQESAKNYTWDKIRCMYQDVWRKLL